MLLFRNLYKIIPLKDIFHYKIISCNKKIIPHVSFRIDLWDVSYLATHWHCAEQPVTLLNRTFFITA